MTPWTRELARAVPSARPGAGVDGPQGGSAHQSRHRAAARGLRSFAAACSLGLALALGTLVAIGPAGRADTTGFQQVFNLPNLPAGGHIWSLAFQPNDVTVALAGTDNGVYRSSDGGQNWVQDGLPKVTVWRVGYAPDAKTDFAATATQGLMRSIDGHTWQPSSTGLTTTDVRTIAFGVLGMVVGTDQGVFISADNGVHWHAAGLQNLHISSVSVVANAPRFTVMAGADGGDIPGTGFLFRSDNGGATWQLIQSGLPAANKVVVDDLQAGPMPAGNPAATPPATPTGTCTPCRPLVLLTSQSPGGVFHSEDGGTTWGGSALPSDQNQAPVVPTTAAWNPGDPNLVYAGADNGGSTGGDLLRSIDGGQHFTTADAGLDPQHREVAAIAVAPSSPPTVLVAIDPVNQSGQQARIYREVDASAPAPSPTGIESGATAPPSLPATAAPTPVPTTVPVIKPGPPPPQQGSSFFSRALGLPFPLALEVLVVLVVVYGGLRWRARRLEIEGPP